MKIPEEYRGREQAYVKHAVLKSYLPRLFMILGRGKEHVINYVDCFAGPWQENDEQLSDTSIGISLAEIESCRQGLFDIFQRRVTFRSLYIEKDPKAFSRLQRFLATTSYDGIETHCMEGDYTDLMHQIVQWCGPHFTFFFVDPKGWLDIIDAGTMRPLLQLPKAEFLITLMYDFVNRAVSIDKHEQDMANIFGQVPLVDGANPDDRRTTLLQMYRRTMTDVYGGRSTYVSIQKPGKDRVHYFLVYLTRNSIGLHKFKEIAESTDFLQRRIRTEVRVRDKSVKSGIDDLFGNDEIPLDKTMQPGSVADAKAFLQQEFSGQVVRFDHNLWADLLERTEFFPSELQAAMKALTNEGLVENLDAQVSRRKKHIVRLDYLESSERWRFKQ